VTRLLVVDDHLIVRAGLKSLLADYEEFTVGGEAASGADAVQMVRESDWDVVLLDISMPDMNGIEALAEIRRIKPKLPVLMLTIHPEDQYAINLLHAGASGYLRKECMPEALVGAIRTVLSGGRYISPELGQQLATGLEGKEQKAPHKQLSEREFQVFCKLARGQAVSEVAKALSLSVKTINTHRSRILEKLRVKSNAHIAYYAVKNGLLK